LIHNNIFFQKNPNLFSFAEEHVISLEKVLNSSDLIDLFRIPMRREYLSEDLTDLGSTAGKDTWTFIWDRKYDILEKIHSFYIWARRAKRGINEGLITAQYIEMEGEEP
jgi:hypothetical protein